MIEKINGNMMIRIKIERDTEHHIEVIDRMTTNIMMIMISKFIFYFNNYYRKSQRDVQKTSSSNRDQRQRQTDRQQRKRSPEREYTDRKNNANDDGKSKQKLDDELKQFLEKQKNKN